MIHSTTILAVRHRDRAVIAGDGQVTLRSDRRQAESQQDSPSLQRSHPGRICRIGGRLVRAVLALRVEARAVSRQHRAVRRRAGEGLAHRSDPAASGSDADRARQGHDVSAVGQRRPHRAGRWDCGDRIGRAVRARRRQGARRQHRARRPRDRREVDGHCQRDLHLYQRAISPWKSCSAYLSARNHPVGDRHAHAAANRRGAGQIRGRSDRGQARRRDRLAQPDAAAEAVARARRGGRAEEHPDDRTDRGRQDGDRPAPGAARAVAVRQGRGLEVHRSRLRRPRRRVDGARSGRAGRRHGPRRADRGSPAQGRAERRGAAARRAAAAAVAIAGRAGRRRRPARAISRARRASASANSSAPAASISASSTSTSARNRSRRSRSSPGRRSRKSTST